MTGIEGINWKEMCKNAIATYKVSFEKNLRSLRELLESDKNLNKKERKANRKAEEEEKLQKIIDSFDTATALKKVKGKASVTTSKQSVISSNKSSEATSSSGSSSSSSSQILISLAQIQTSRISILEHSVHKCKKRIQRWRERDPNIIRTSPEFNDTRIDAVGNKIQVNLYAQKSDDDIRMQRMRHHLPGLEKLVTPENKNVYYIETEEGISMAGMLLRNGKDDGIDVEYGDVIFCFDKKSKNSIYHKMFRPWPGTENDYKKLINGPSPTLEESLGNIDEESSDDKEWEIAGNCTWDVLPGGLVEFSFPNEVYKLRIYPLSDK
jgi:hypothetical protein